MSTEKLQLVDVNTAVDELGAIYTELFNISDDSDVVNRPGLIHVALEQLDKIVVTLTLLAELADLIDPETAASHRDNLAFFEEMKIRLLAEQNRLCHHFLSGTFH